MSAQVRPHIVLSLGDVNGVGPEVVLKSLRNADVRNACEPILVGNARLLKEYVASVAMDFVDVRDDSVAIGEASFRIVDVPSDARLHIGHAEADAGKLAGDSIVVATQMILDGEAEGIVTAPISKETLQAGGHDFPGHTEMLASLTGGDPLMILMTPGMRVALATIHVPLWIVPSLITADLVVRRIRQFARSLKIDFGVDTPRIAVLGLNPHAGENGTIGDEELAYVEPALEILMHEGFELTGPHPADGFFARYEPEAQDGVLALYHDQGLIPLKMYARGSGVNVTAGLPIVRTSPDHGVAWGIAGKGIADERSTVEALMAAVQIIDARANRNGASRQDGAAAR